MRVGSLFAGIGGFDLAAERAGMEVVFQSEIDKYASRVLDHHWPHIKNLGDIHGITDPPAVDVLCGGFPCQSYSVAGNRGGLADDRGALWWEMDRLIGELRPTWVVGENVPGILSSRGGADFETIIRSLTERGYGVVWAVLDAQYFGVAQRRRRVFIVGHSGGIPRPEILALGQGVFGDSPPSREKGERVAPTLASRTRGGGGLGTFFDLDGGLIAKQNQSLRAGTKQSTGIVAYALQPDDRNLGRGGLKAQELDGRSPTLGAYNPNHSDRGALILNPGMKQQTYVLQGGGRTSLGSHGDGWDEELSYTLNTTDQHAIVGFKDSRRDGQSRPGVVATGFEDDRRTGIRLHGEVAPTLQAFMGTGGNNTPMVDTPTVRRLTPLECERLQGFPDGWTAIPGNSDTQRYRQLGNAVAVPVVEWIMRRIVEAS